MDSQFEMIVYGSLKLLNFTFIVVLQNGVSIVKIFTVCELLSNTNDCQWKVVLEEFTSRNITNKLSHKYTFMFLRSIS